MQILLIPCIPYVAVMANKHVFYASNFDSVANYSQYILSFDQTEFLHKFYVHIGQLYFLLL